MTWAKESTWEEYRIGLDVLVHAFQYLRDRGRLSLDAHDILSRAHGDVLDAMQAKCRAAGAR